MRVLLLTPPMTQLNTPYPATAYLTGFLRSRTRHEITQADPAIDLFLRIFSRSGFERIQSRLSRPQAFSRHIATVDSVVRFLQGKDPTLAMRICSRKFLPEGQRFRALSEFGSEEESLGWAFGALGVQDQAKYLASLYIDDCMDFIQAEIDPKFALSRYGEKLAASTPTFGPLHDALIGKPTLIDEILDELTAELFAKHRPEVLGISLPFPGNVYGGLRIAKKMKELSPELKIVLGGGYVNTELRSLKDPGIFAFVDFITLDDGERPFLAILERLERGEGPLLRTFVREKEGVILKTSTELHDIPHKDTGTPTYDGLKLDSYLSIFEMLNPMHRIWSDGRWNKLTLAHGCYWKKCNFCDVNLDYIGRYDAASADLIVDRIESMIRETGTRGFHFVDEAAPPAVLRAMAEKLISRGVAISWWGNIRFEKTFTPELTELLARSGCIAVSGGLEVASDRLLTLMQKGVNVEQVARVTRAFTESGIMVHAYLMYGFPTQTIQETVDSLERVRQLFEQGVIQSAFWHRFSATAHSPIGRNPEKFGIRLLPQPDPVFAKNDLSFEDPTPCPHDLLGPGLKRALYNYMHGTGLDMDVRFWFTEMPKGKVPAPRVPRDLIARARG